MNFVFAVNILESACNLRHYFPHRLHGDLLGTGDEVPSHEIVKVELTQFHINVVERRILDWALTKNRHDMWVRSGLA